MQVLAYGAQEHCTSRCMWQEGHDQTSAARASRGGQAQMPTSLALPAHFRIVHTICTTVSIIAQTMIWTFVPALQHQNHHMLLSYPLLSHPDLPLEALGHSVEVWCSWRIQWTSCHRFMISLHCGNDRAHAWSCSCTARTQVHQVEHPCSAQLTEDPACQHIQLPYTAFFTPTTSTGTKPRPPSAVRATVAHAMRMSLETLFS
jgi:hypothetical protein